MITWVREKVAEKRAKWLKIRKNEDSCSTDRNASKSPTTKQCDSKM